MVVALLLAAGSAGARTMYLANYDEDNVLPLDSVSLQPVGAAIQTGNPSGPFSIAVTPDGKTAYAANYDTDDVIAIDTATNTIRPPAISVGESPQGIAINPQGTRVYVANEGDEYVSVIDLADPTQPVVKIPTNGSVQQVSVSPDGTRAYASTGAEVDVIDTAAAAVIGTLTVSGPYGTASSPDGKLLFVAGKAGTTIFDAATLQPLGSPLPTGSTSSIVVVAPNGGRAYVSAYQGAIAAIDLSSRQIVGAFPYDEVEWLAMPPSGAALLAGQFGKGKLLALDPVGGGLLASFSEEDNPGQVAVVPDRSPTGGVLTPGTARPGVPITIDGSSSTDPDGKVASWAWTFGDGQSATVTTPTVAHTYEKPGKYPLTVKVTDDEGCGEAEVFTGTTAYCSGQNPGHLPGPASAVPAPVVTVAYPGVKLKCPKSAGPGGCKFKLKAVQRKKKGKLKALSAVTRGKAKSGKAVVISLKPKKSSAKKLASAKKVLVQLTTKVAGVQKITVKKLRIVQ